MIFTLILAVAGWQLATAGYMLGKAWLSQYLIAQAWQQTLVDNKAHKPWSWADTYPLFELSLPRLDQHSHVLAGASGRNLAFSSAHVSARGLPGQLRSSIVSGHRDSHFAFLQDVLLGDEIVVISYKGRLSYHVTSMQIIDSRKTQLTIRNKAELILTTCYPFNALTAGGDLRYVIYAELG